MDAETYDNSRSGHGFRRRFGTVRDYLKTANSKKVLEVGCGTGALLGRLAGDFKKTSFMGIDTNGEFVEFARKKYGRRAKFGEGDIRSQKGKFDAVVTVDMLHHIDYPLEEFADNVHRLLSAGGNWIVFDHNVLNPYIFLWQMIAEGRVFNFLGFKRAISRKFLVKDERKLILIPSAIKDPKPWMLRLERSLEGVPFLGGSRAYLCQVVKGA